MLKQGSRGDEVKELQSILDDLGFNPGPIDGIFGPKTESAVKKFQESQGLVIDGIVGPKTWSKLDPEGHNPEEIEKDSQVDTPLPRSGIGYYTKKNESLQFGRRSTIEALLSLGKEWHKQHNDAPRIRIGDISREGGGKFPPHKSHQTGIDVDIGLMRSDGIEDATNISHSSYSRPLTRELIKMVFATGSVKVIFFNDKDLIGEKLVKKWPGHDNHLHVRYNG